jgi:hypothetical protein
MLHALLSPVCYPPCIVEFMVLPRKLKATLRNGNPRHPAPGYFPLHAEGGHHPNGHQWAGLRWSEHAKYPFATHLKSARDCLCNSTQITTKAVSALLSSQITVGPIHFRSYACRTRTGRTWHQSPLWPAAVISPRPRRTARPSSFARKTASRSHEGCAACRRARLAALGRNPVAAQTDGRDWRPSNSLAHHDDVLVARLSRLYRLPGLPRLLVVAIPTATARPALNLSPRPTETASSLPKRT